MFNLIDELNRINKAHHAIMGYPAPVPIRPALDITIPEGIRRDTDRDQEPHDEHNRQA